MCAGARPGVLDVSVDADRARDVFMTLGHWGHMVVGRGTGD